MKQPFKKLNSSTLVVLLALSVGLMVPAKALGEASGSNGVGAGDENSTTSPSTRAHPVYQPVSQSGDSSSSSGDHSTADPSHVSSLVDQFHQAGTDAAKDALRAKETDKLKQARVKVCDSRQSSIQSRITNTENFASAYKDKLDSTYTKVKDFYISKNLTVSNYDQLTAAVDSAQADATAKIAALKATSTTVDCADQNVADGLSAYRAALSATRDSLKAYHSALSDLIKAVRQAAEAASSTSGEGN